MGDSKRKLIAGRLITIEGSDFSGKETQAKLLRENLAREGYVVWDDETKSQFPRYDTPTGKVIGGPLLGKEHICPSFWEDGAGSVDPMVAAMYYAADRYANSYDLYRALNQHDIVVLDRYVESNMAHQMGKYDDRTLRREIYDFIEKLEYSPEFLNLPRPFIGFVLYVPYETAVKLREKRAEKADDAERDEEYLRNSIAAFLEVAERRNFHLIECAPGGEMRTREDIAKEILGHVLKELW